MLSLLHDAILMAREGDGSRSINSELLADIAAKKVLRTEGVGLYRSIRKRSAVECKTYLAQDPQYARLVAMINNYSLLSSDNNAVDILINGEEKFPPMLKDLRDAKDHIHFQYYIYEPEGIGQAIGDILKRKAREGVEVRFLYDAFGSKFISPSFLAELRDAGVQVASYLGFDLRHPIRTLNNRNHRKIVVIDGRVSYLGGLNIADRYINVDSTRSKNPYYWRDTHIRIEGEATRSLQYIFMGDWNFATNEDLALDDRYFPSMEEDHGDVFVQSLSSGPDDEQPLLLAALEEAIAATRKELLIVTPYYVPDQSLQRAIVDARRRGVDVQMMIPGMTDALLVNSVARSYYRRLLKHGVKLWEYQPGFIHAKTIISDGKLSILGSANVDRRSFFINFEVCSFIYDQGLSQQLRQSYMEDRGYCVPIRLEDWDARPAREKVYENTLRVLAPLF